MFKKVYLTILVSCFALCAYGVFFHIYIINNRSSPSATGDRILEYSSAAGRGAGGQHPRFLNQESWNQLQYASDIVAFFGTTLFLMSVAYLLFYAINNNKRKAG